MAGTSSSGGQQPSKRKRASGSHPAHPDSSDRRRSTSASSRGSESDADSVASSSAASSAKKQKKKKKKKKAGSASSSSYSTHGDDRRAERPPYLSQVPLSSAFQLQYPVLTLSIPPIHASQPVVALTELIDSLVMRFVPPLNGVLVSQGQAFFMVDAPDTATRGPEVPLDELWKGVGPSALIGADAAFGTVKAAVECCVWRPKVGMKLEGTITLSTPSHVSLLIHNTFNASISSEHMTAYEFIESSTPPRQGVNESSPSSPSSEDSPGDSGYWRHRVTRERLGASTGGRVQFAVISLTISPPSLSLSGSLLDRPFHVAPPTSLGASSTAAAAAAGSGAWGRGTGEPGKGLQKEDGEAIKRATRRVRWEEDDEESDEEEVPPMQHEARRAGAKPVKF